VNAVLAIEVELINRLDLLAVSAFFFHANIYA
jgi:hypothetical protein